ncbi:GNAT family N-acetyltransferase [Pseudomonas luteola]|uniref:GNAT family N-acetyltransferase n=1 Tax=Pseudomonas luteola TaxID=47886 RepID=UPI00123C0701|nr:GNAT family N-acetyltransferase [Pseudomonas luteola]QEU26718.1 GNAT family N-acetyltransferase [Pseudomonas luteola]
MAFKVKLARVEDSRALSELATRTFAMACPKKTSAEDLRTYIQESLQPSHFKSFLNEETKQIFLLYSNETLIGYSMIDTKPQPLGIEEADRDILELTRCYVVSEYHGKGAAQHLLSTTLESITGRVRLTVSKENKRAISFYKRNGFEPSGETTFRCGKDLQRDLIMTCYLPSHSVLTAQDPS